MRPRLPFAAAVVDASSPFRRRRWSPCSPRARCTGSSTTSCWSSRRTHSVTGSADAMSAWPWPSSTESGCRRWLRHADTLTRAMQPTTDRPQPGSHDRSVPSGSLEESAAYLFDAMLAAREAEERGERGPLDAFYRTLMSGTLLLPVPPEHGDEAKAALESAVNDDEQVEISVMLARDAGGEPVSVIFASFGALAAWAPSGTGNLPLPARIAIANLAAAGMPAIMDPAGPVPYRFDAAELAALAAGTVPGTGEPLFEATARTSIRVRLPGRDTSPLE